MALKLASVVLLMGMMMMMMMGAPISQATITCGQVSSSLSSCIDYLKGAGGEVPPACCSGVKSLDAAATTTPDRQAACNCLKSAAASVPGINPSLASGLPGKCGVSIPYQISPSADCTRVQ